MAELVNIDDRGVSVRLTGAVAAVGLSLAVMVAMAKLHAPPASFALLFLPFFGASTLTFQGLYKT